LIVAKLAGAIMGSGPLSRGGRVTEKMTPEGANMEPLICRVGSTTDNPCPRVATEYVNWEDRPDWCWPHFFSMQLRTTAEEITAMLDERQAELERWILSQQSD
jgi:hypothetical protein